MEFLQSLFGAIGDFTWGWSLIPFLVIYGLFFTVASNFAQFRFFGRMFRVLNPKYKPDDPDAISGREALFLSIGGRVGGGNIAGVAVAITLGGPGAVFWMWMTALIGMVTSIVECTLAQVYKRKDAEGVYRGGAAQTIIYGLGENYRWFANIYAFCLMVSFALGFNAFQGNTVAGAALDSMGIDRLYTAIFLAATTAFILFGGLKRITKTSDIIVPIMAFIYVGLSLLIILMNIGQLPAVISDIIQNALGLKQAVGGGIGAAIAQGMRRGLFSNEAGLGSASNVAATARVKHPIGQGISQALSVFIDTILICSCTAFVILLGNVYQPGAEGIDGIALTQQSVASHVGGWAQYFLTVAILLFSFSSIIYNYFLGENGLTFMTSKSAAVFILRIATIGLVFLGAVAPGATSVFFFSDPLMGVLALVNLIALLMLFPTFTRVLADFQQQLKEGKDRPVFDPDKFSDLNLDKNAWKNWKE